jgi:DNA polymerase-3 subunit epsilon
MRQIILERPLVVLDTETTGMDFMRDRIVEFAAVKLHVDGRRETLRTLINPKEPIPFEASRVHGITDEMVRDAPTFVEAAADILRFMAGADLAGYNIGRFDLPILRHELERVGMELPLEGVRVVDAQAIFFNREPRDLSAAVRFYCGREHTGAHGALADSEATLEVLLAQIARYEDLPAQVEGLACESVVSGGDRYVDDSRRFIWRHGEAHFNFGAHRGKSLREISESDRDRGFLKWILAKDFSEEVKAIVRGALEGKFPEKKK